MTAVNLNAWLDCNNEMDMDSFIQQFDNDRALRAFAILNAKSVLEHLVDTYCQFGFRRRQWSLCRLQFLEPGTIADGVFDGAGGANIATFNLEIVPEPTSGLILLTLIPIVYCRRVR